MKWIFVIAGSDVNDIDSLMLSRQAIGSNISIRRRLITDTCCYHGNYRAEPPRATNLSRYVNSGFIHRLQLW